MGRPNRISLRATQTRLFKERDKLGISYCWETKESVTFEKCEEDEEVLPVYYLTEVFVTGEIMVSDDNGFVVDKTDRILNLFRLDI